jgi:hypothetical protein
MTDEEMLAVHTYGPRWVKCSAQLPDPDERVLICNREGFVQVAQRFVFPKHWHWAPDDGEGVPEDREEVTHWMPLPAPPEDE